MTLSKPIILAPCNKHYFRLLYGLFDSRIVSRTNLLSVANKAVRLDEGEATLAAAQEISSRRAVNMARQQERATAREEGKRSGVYFDADHVAQELADKLVAKRDELKRATAKARA